MRSPRLQFWVLLLVAGLGIGYLALKAARSTPRTPAAAALEPLEEIPNPALNQAEKEVQDQIAEARRPLEGGPTAVPAADRGARAAAFGNLGMIYQVYRFRDAAAACYRNATRLTPKDPAWFYLLGQVELQQGATDAAVAALRTAESLQRTTPGVRQELRVAIHCWLGAGLVQLGQAAPARGQFESALGLDPQCVYARAELGRLLLQEGQHAEALKHLQLAANQVPRQTEVLRNLATACTALGRTNEAAQLEAGLTRSKARAQPLSPPDPSAAQRAQLDRSLVSRIRRGRDLVKAGRFAEAEPLLREALERQATNRNARVFLAVAVDSLGRTDEAQAMFESLRETSTTEPDVAYRLALIYLRQPSRRPEAIALLEELVKKTPNDAESLGALGRALFFSGKPAESLPHFRAARNTKPSAIPSWVGEAETLAALGQPEAALSVFDELKTQYPRSPVPDLVHARFLIRTTGTTVRNPARALDLAQSANAARPSDDGFETVALALAANHRFPEAADVQRGLLERRGAAMKPTDRAQIEANLTRYERGQPGIDRTWHPE